MDATRADFSPHTADFMLALRQLGPELDGYPVSELLGFLGNPSADAQAGHRLVDQCLSSWITALESALDAMPSELDDSLTRLAHRQRGARNALMRLKSTLPALEFVRPNGGQLC